MTMALTREERHIRDQIVVQLVDGHVRVGAVADILHLTPTRIREIVKKEHSREPAPFSILPEEPAAEPEPEVQEPTDDVTAQRKRRGRKDHPANHGSE